MLVVFVDDAVVDAAPAVVVAAVVVVVEPCCSIVDLSPDIAAVFGWFVVESYVLFGLVVASSILVTGFVLDIFELGARLFVGSVRLFLAILPDEGKDQQIEGTFDSAAVAVDLLLVPVVFVYIEHFAASVLDYMVVAVDKYK